MSSLARHADGHGGRSRGGSGYNTLTRPVVGWAMAITGTHALLYTSQPEELRALLKDAFSWDHIDVHDGWLIFRLPPAELGVHPATMPSHEITLMCDDLVATMSELASKGVVFEGDPQDQGFGTVATMVLPGDVKMLLYEPRHKTAI